MEQRSGTGNTVCSKDGSTTRDDVDKRHNYGQHSSSMEIQLAPSETKPFTRSAMLYHIALIVDILYFYITFILC